MSIERTINHLLFGALVLCSLAWVPAPAKAVLITSDDAFVLDFVANGDGSGGLSNLTVAVYWQWDGGNTLGIRMETPDVVGFGNFWSFNIFNNGASPGGIDSNGSNNTVNVISASGNLTATSLGAFTDPVDAIEGSWTMPGAFDPLQDAVYIQLSIFGPSGPSDGYRMAEYLGQGGTYSNSPDILFPASGFCFATNGTCATLSFAQAVPEPASYLMFLFGLGVLLGLRRLAPASLRSVG